MEEVYTGDTPKEEIDIILLTHGRLHDLTIPAVTCLYSHTRSKFHLIVVDDSTPDLPSGVEKVPDTTADWFDKFQIDHNNVSFVHSSIPFKNGNQVFNVGLSHCRNRFAAIVMNSVQVEPDWDVVAVQMMHQNPKIGIIGLKCLKFGWGEKEDGQIECAGIGISPQDGYTPIDLGRNETSHRLAISQPVWSLQWAFVLVRVEAAKGNLDENLWEGFVGFDDIDNTLTLRSKGWEAWYCGLGTGYHRTHATRGSTDTDVIFKNRKNAEIFYKRWGMWDKYKATNPYSIEYFPNGNVKHICNIMDLPLTVVDKNVAKETTNIAEKEAANV